MDTQGIRDVIKRINGPNAQISRNGDWLTTSCPFARWTHARGQDRSPSFGIVENKEGKSVFHCFTCKQKGTVAMLWEQLGEYDGQDYSDEARDSDTTEILGPRPPKWGDYRSQGEPVSRGVPISDEVFYVFTGAYDARPSKRYLRKRGIRRSTSERLRLLYDEDDGHGVRRILFAVYDFFGDLYGFTGRAIDSKIEPRVRDYHGLEKRRLLLGAHDCPRSRGRRPAPVVLVEGLFDYAKARQCGFDAVAALHSGITPEQTRILAGLGRPIIVAFDNDEAGEKGTDQVKRALSGRPLLKIRYPEGVKDIGDMEDRDIKRMLKDTRLL